MSKDQGKITADGGEGKSTSSRQCKRPAWWSLDGLGACASALCMVHCLIFPLLAVAIPFARQLPLPGPFESPLSTKTPATEHAGPPLDSQSTASVSPADVSGSKQFLPACCWTGHDLWIHAGLLGVVIPVGLIALLSGYRRHRELDVLLLGAAGMGMLAAALIWGVNLFDGAGERLLTVGGSIAMVSAHLWNRERCACRDHLDVGNGGSQVSRTIDERRA